MKQPRQNWNGLSERYRKEYQAWCAARSRCSDPDDPSFANYGARGITMCARWFSNFGFFLVDMGRCPAGMSLDRIDNNGNYEPDNCRWATVIAQGVNRRTTVWLEHGGAKMPLLWWAKMDGISTGSFRHQLSKGWSVGEILSYYKWKKSLINQKKCSKCGAVKGLGLFPKESGSKTGRASHCKECHNAYGKFARIGGAA